MYDEELDQRRSHRGELDELDLAEPADGAFPEHPRRSPGKRTRTMSLVQRAHEEPGARSPAKRTRMMGLAMQARSRGMAAEVLQRKASGSSASPDDDDAPHPALERSGGGRPLPEAVRQLMEQALGADFSAVRVHEGPQAQAIGALAFTHGTDIHFAPGQYAPETPRGRELIGHELAHVVQQAQGRVSPTTQAGGVPINANDALEHEADELGARAAAAHGTAMATPASEPARAPSITQGATSGEVRQLKPNQQQNEARQRDPNKWIKLEFDGTYLSIISLKTGKPLKKLKATSGLPPGAPHTLELIQKGRTDLDPKIDYRKPQYQNVADAGPIPEGTYQRVLNKEMAFDKQGGGWGAGGWILQQGLLKRIGNRLGLSRGGFFLHHDGGNPGTAGCIGIKAAKDVRELQKLFRTSFKSGQSEVEIQVRYKN